MTVVASSFFQGKRVLVTGGHGFLGGYVAEQAVQAGAHVLRPSSAECDLREPRACEELFHTEQPEVVLHCAVDGGGIAYMRANPGSVLTHNVQMNTHVMDAARRHGVQRFMGVSSACVYPREAMVPMCEKDIWAGYPEPSNAAYGISKRLMMEQGLAYQQQYGFSCAFPVPANLYGPRDDFEPSRSHVVAALVRRFLEARDSGDEEVVVWGSGRATREFLYVEDCAAAILEVAASEVCTGPINLGTGIETSVSELAQLVARACDYEGQITWDESKPDGQPRKSLDVTNAHHELQWRATVSLQEGLQRTVRWYSSH